MTETYNRDDIGLKRNLDSIRDGIFSEQVPNKCSECINCYDLHGLQSAIQKPFGAATLVAALKIGESNAEITGACRNYEGRRTLMKAFDPTITKQMLGELYNKPCRYQKIKAYEDYADMLEEVTELGMCNIEDDANHSVKILNGYLALLKTDGQLYAAEMNYRDKDMGFVPKEHREKSRTVEMDGLKSAIEKETGKSVKRVDAAGPVDGRTHVTYKDESGKLYVAVSSPWD